MSCRSCFLFVHHYKSSRTTQFKDVICGAKVSVFSLPSKLFLLQYLRSTAQYSYGIRFIFLTSGRYNVNQKCYVFIFIYMLSWVLFLFLSRRDIFIHMLSRVLSPFLSRSFRLFFFSFLKICLMRNITVFKLFMSLWDFFVSLLVMHTYYIISVVLPDFACSYGFRHL